MSSEMIVQSRSGPYSVKFEDSRQFDVARFPAENSHLLIDSNVANLYADQLEKILSRPTTILIEATEENKSLESITPVLHKLVANSIRRDHSIIAIGGGIVQDICCFAASTLLRGVPWKFIPTTLLAQADSCIGSKSSINLGSAKNILGTFNPPSEIFIYSSFLNSLNQREIYSGIGEMLKVHAIDGYASFNKISNDYDKLVADRVVLSEYIRASLEIKKRFIEVDEFDRGVRNIFNYGHSFGHAIESATKYLVPHGIGVSIGMDMANFVSAERGLTPRKNYLRMNVTLRKNYLPFAKTKIPFDSVIAALRKDKKNTNTMLGLILPVGNDAKIERVMVPLDGDFKESCSKFLVGLPG